jgi:hypothetical protein
MEKRKFGTTLAEPSSEEWDEPNLQQWSMLKRFRDLPEAALAKGSLESAGIECHLVDENMVRLDWFISNLLGGVKLVVKPEELVAAREILEQPIPEGIEYEEGGTFDQPKCPKCGSLDISFESLNKPIAYGSAWLGFPLPIRSDTWKCHACGATWEEMTEEDQIPEERG